MVKGKYVNFILSCIRRAKSQIITVALLFLVASALINTFLFLSFDYTQNFYREKEKLDGVDIDYLYFNTVPDPQDREKLLAALSEVEGVREFEVNRVTAGHGSVEFNGSLLCKDLSILDYQEALDKKIGRYEIPESDGESGIILSYLFKVEGGYSIGDTVAIRIGNREEKFRVAGFYNNVNTGTINCTDIAFLLTEDVKTGYDSAGCNAYRIDVLLDDPEQAPLMEAVIAKKITDTIPTMYLQTSSSVQKLSSARYITTTILQAVICLGAVLMIAVVLTVIAVTLSNYIQNNKKSLGTLKALGYTSNNLIVPLVAEFSAIALIMSSLGTGLSYLLFPVLNNAMEKQTGIPYEIRFLPEAAVLAIAICVVLAALTSYFSVAPIRTVAPIHAIRESRSAKGVRHSFFALDKTRLGLNTALSLKTWISATGRNLVIFFSITGVAFLIGFACFCYQNIIFGQEDIIDLVCGQTTDSAVGVRAPLEDALCEELEKCPEIERFYMYSLGTITPKDKPKIYAYISDGTEQYDESRLCISGKLPANGSEIALNGTYAENCGLKTGDTLTFDVNGENVDFTVSGIVQGAFYAGLDSYITREGYTRLAPLYNISYYIDLKDGEDVEAFNKKIGEKCNILSAVDYRKSIETLSVSYIRLLTLATVVVVVLSFIIAGFILYILISVFLSNKKREHGILKSLGFVTGNIIYQTVLSITPTCAAAVVLGLALSRRGAGALLTSALNGIGIFSFGTPIRVLFLAAAGLAMLGFIVLYATLLSGSVRKITPHKLFTNE